MAAPVVFARIQATKELRAHLDALGRSKGVALVAPTGKPCSKRYFNEHWREDADKVCAADLNFHGNHGTAATLLAEAGATARVRRGDGVVDGEAQ